MITGMSITNNTLMLVIDNGAEILPATSDHPKWKEILAACSSKNETFLRSLISMKSVIEKYSVGMLSVDNAGVTYNGQPLHTVDADRVMAFLREGLPYQPIANYMNRKMANPSARAINEMYNFLEHKGMPLTDEGKIIAYKGVANDYWSIKGNPTTIVLQGTVNKDGHILNTVGSTIEVQRNCVDDNPNNGCGPGLHAGSLEYAKNWGPRIMLIEIDPADVVSVPLDSKCQKLRFCKGKVVGEFTGKLPDHYTNEFSIKKNDVYIPQDNTDDTETEDRCPDCDCLIEECDCNRYDCQGDDMCECAQCQNEHQSTGCQGDPDPDPESKDNAAMDEVMNKLVKDITGEEENYPEEDIEYNEKSLNAILNELQPNAPKLPTNEKFTPTPLYIELVNLFAEELNIDLENIYPHMTPANMGADSLDGVELAIAIEDKYHIDINDEDLDFCWNIPLSEIAERIASEIVTKHDNINVLDGVKDGQLDMNHGVPAKYIKGDEIDSDSVNQQLYILGYLKGSGYSY